MREAVGTTSIFKIMLAVIFVFVGFIAVAINYNMAYRVKNQSISILEKYEGKRPEVIKILNDYLKNSGYSDRGRCPTSVQVDGKTSFLYGSTNLDSVELQRVKNNVDYFYCLNYEINEYEGISRIKYDIRVFSKFSLPVIGDLLTFKVSGETKSIKLFDLRSQILN